MVLHYHLQGDIRMTKKKLLNETTIRRWGKLANIGPLTENFLEEE